MSNRDRAVVLGIVAAGLVGGAYVIFFRPEPYEPTYPDASADAARAMTPSESAPGAAASADLARDGGGPILDKKRHDEVLAAIRAMLAEAGPVLPGAAPAAPHAPPPTGAGTMPTDKAELKKYVQDRVRSDFFPLAMKCYEDALQKNEKLGGRVVVKFKIVGDKSIGGVVESATVDRDAGSLEDPRMLDCMTSSMESIVFDAPPQEPDGGPGHVTVDYPFVFSPDGEPDH